MADYVFAVEGLENIDQVQGLAEDIVRAARMAVNRTTERARARGAKEIRKEVAFPASYLTGERGRLKVTEKATAQKLQGKVTGRGRPTSLARFAKAKAPGKAGLKVTVKPGSTKEMKKAFLLRLPQGSTLTDTQFNLGLAIRLKDGERVQNKKSMVKLGKGLYLLYGPSVDQVFRDVAKEISPDTADFLEAEFLRLVSL